MTEDELDLVRKGFRGIIQMRLDHSISQAPDLVHFEVKAMKDGGGGANVAGCFIRRNMNPFGGGGDLAAQAACEETGFLVSELLQNWKTVLGTEPLSALWFHQIRMHNDDSAAVYACMIRALQVFDCFEHDPQKLRAVHLHPMRKTKPVAYHWPLLFTDFGFQQANKTVFERLAHFALSWPDELLVLQNPRKGSFLDKAGRLV